MNTDIASGWFNGPSPGIDCPSAIVPCSASVDGTPYAGNVMPAVARLSGVTPGISGYSNMPTLETQAVRSSGERATAKGCLPTRTDWRTWPLATSTVTSRKLNWSTATSVRPSRVRTKSPTKLSSTPPPSMSMVATIAPLVEIEPQDLPFVGIADRKSTGRRART